MIDQNTQIAVMLRAQEWNTLMALIAEGPYKLAAPLIAAIQQQCMGHDAPMRVSGGANGGEPQREGA
jgi:hypothetical protein